MPALTRSLIAAAAAGLIAFLLWGLSGAPAQVADPWVVELRLADGAVSGADVDGVGRRAVLRVRQGTAVELRWTTDTATDLHLHGYGVVSHATVGGEAVMAFVAEATGRFPIEAHDLGNRTVLYVEVLPR